MANIVNQAFRGQTVTLNGDHYIDCVFDQSVLIYIGKATNMTGCDITRCEWRFEGAAADTLSVLQHLWAMGGNEMVLQPIMAQISGDPIGAKQFIARGVKRAKKKRGPIADH